MGRIPVHYRIATLASYTVGSREHRAETSTRPGYHVATIVNGFVEPGSLRTYPTAIEAVQEAERRAGNDLRAGIAAEEQA